MEQQWEHFVGTSSGDESLGLFRSYKRALVQLPAQEARRFALIKGSIPNIYFR